MIQFKRDTKQNSNKLHLDKYFTSDELAQYCVKKTKEVIGRDVEFLEPSAGNGVFLKYLPTGTKAYDIEPENDIIIKQDFLELDLPYNENLCIIGNPPYGSRLNLALAFCNKAFELAEYVSFILPISQLNNNQSIYKYDLVHSEDLGKREYSDRKVYCCLNIYRKPNDKRYNNKCNYKNSEIIEIREVVVNSNPKRNRELRDFNYDFAICAWGASIGKECNDGDFAKTFFIKIKDVNNFEYWKNLILSAKWQDIYPMTATPNLLQWQVYKHLKEQTPELEYDINLTSE